MAKIVVDGKTYEVDERNNLLRECLSRGLDLPYFCWHPSLGSVGACRQCAVKQYRDGNDNQGAIVMACMTPARDGTRIAIEDPEARDFRAMVIESLMISHPHDCPVCEEGGECHLQDMTLMSGHNYRRYDKRKVTHRNQYLGPFINHEMNRCIACYRCVRYYNDYAGGDDLAALASHHHVYFGRHQDGTLESEFSGNLVEVCPTGVFTDRPFSRRYVRKWDLQTAPSVCVGCAVGCNTAPGERGGILRRVVNRYHPAVNGYFLCDRGRFGADYVTSAERLLTASRRGEEAAAAVVNGAGAALGSAAGAGSDSAGGAVAVANGAAAVANGSSAALGSAAAGGAGGDSSASGESVDGGGVDGADANGAGNGAADGANMPVGAGGAKGADGAGSGVAALSLHASRVRVPADEALEWLRTLERDATVGIGSPRAGNEANFALRQFVGRDNFHAGCAAAEHEAMQVFLQVARDPAFHLPSVREMERADAVLILGEDITNTAPRVALALRQAVRGKAFAIAAARGIPPWHDDAVREAAQHERSPLVMVGSCGTRLDDVASQRLALAPKDVAAFGFRLAQALDGKAPASAEPGGEQRGHGGHDGREGQGGPEGQEAQAGMAALAATLLAAERPLIVSGIGGGHVDYLRAAANIARALGVRRGGAPVALCLAFPEVNSVGAGMLTPADNSLAAALAKIESGAARHLVVLENDLFRRVEHGRLRAALAKLDTLVVLDQLPSATTAAADLVLPTTAFSEHQASYVSSEGRAQLSFMVHRGRGDARPAWQWLAAAADLPGHFDELLRACADRAGQDGGLGLEFLASLLPDAGRLVAGMKIPRQTHRHSGRTASQANVNVHEAKQPQDDESVFAFSMEGIPPQKDSSLIASSWAPHWNSNQSIAKFQDEIDGDLKQGHPGLLLFADKGAPGQYFAAPPAAGARRGAAGLRLTAACQVFGSEELSAQAPALRERMTAPWVALSPADAARLGLTHGDAVTLSAAAAQAGSGRGDEGGQGHGGKGSSGNGSKGVALVCVRASVPMGVAALYVGDSGIDRHGLGEALDVAKCEQRPSGTIATLNGLLANDLVTGGRVP